MSVSPHGTHREPGAGAAPTPAFIGVSWAAVAVGMTTFLLMLWAARMPLLEKGFYLTLLLFGLFATVSLQKAVRDAADDVPVTNLYLGLAWSAVGSALLLLIIGLWNADGYPVAERGLYGMAYCLSLFGAVAVQKNVRDSESAKQPGRSMGPLWGRD